MSHTWLELDLAPSIAELEQAQPALSSAVDRFARDLEVPDARKPVRRNTSITHGQLPKLARRRPIHSRVRLPVRLHMRTPSTLLQPRGGNAIQKRMTSGAGAELQMAVEHVAEAIRNRLLILRKGFEKFHTDFGRFATVVHLASLSISGRRTL